MNSVIPEKLASWPLNCETNQPDTEGMGVFLTDRIVAYAQDYTVLSQRVDQKPLDDILERLSTIGVAGLTEDDLPHVANACAMAVAIDEISTARACLAMVAEYVELTKKSAGSN